MFKSNKTYIIPVTYTVDGNIKRDYWNITIFCKARSLYNDDVVADYESISQFIEGKLSDDKLNNLVEFDPTEELMAKWICEQIVPCYKVEIITSDSKTIIYEEDKY